MTRGRRLKTDGPRAFRYMRKVDINQRGTSGPVLPRKYVMHEAAVDILAPGYEPESLSL